MVKTYRFVRVVLKCQCNAEKNRRWINRHEQDKAVKITRFGKLGHEFSEFSLLTFFFIACREE